MTTWLWGTVTGVTPLRIRIDGDSEPLPVTPDTLVSPDLFRAGQRVRCELTDRRIIIHGIAGGP